MQVNLGISFMRASWLLAALYRNTGTLLTGHYSPGNRKFLAKWPYSVSAQAINQEVQAGVSTPSCSDFAS